MKTLITGGAGYIGSTIASACLDAGIVPVILDDLSTGREEFTEGRAFYRGDIADGDVLDTVFRDHPDISAVIHCAAKIVVPESVRDPLGYYANNVSGTIALVQHLLRHGCERFLFSSSASIYQPGPDLSVDESSPVDPQSPYAATKMMVERVLADAASALPLRVISLRYFNPVGADPLLRTGLQSPAPTHALGKLIEAYESGTPFTITGTDWPTRDGSGIRDYIHVWDLAEAHVRALERFDEVVPAPRGYEVINLGTGRGTTVRELASAFQDAVGDRLQVREAGPRPGDAVGCFTRSDKAAAMLGWSATRTEKDGALDSLAWARKRPTILGR
ncbi:UDP-glucose 4-epimerase GalE [Actinopolymorpha sp. B11F2]|uniref:UDP-glucose 4-epimerase GalE n=1 Tax=Actinopolymorpha sp. B11F2 TaxID=3160862 RepID=UPI0032E3E655